MEVLAHDERGNLVHALAAEPGKKYYCPRCGCNMHLVRRNNIVFFRRARGTLHTHRDCQKTNDETINRRLKDITLISVEEFICRLMKKTAPPVIPPGGDKAPGNEGEERDDPPPYVPPTEKGIIQRIAYGSLSDIFRAGLHKYSAIALPDNQKITDYLISGFTSAVIMGDNKNLGARMIECVYNSYDWQKMLIRFAIYCSVPAAKYYKKKILLLEFDDRETFDKWCHELYPVKKHLFVAGIWTAEQDCHKWCRGNCGEGKYACTGMQRAKFGNDKQIFVFPE